MLSFAAPMTYESGSEVGSGSGISRMVIGSGKKYFFCVVIYFGSGVVPAAAMGAGWIVRMINVPECPKLLESVVNS